MLLLFVWFWVSWVDGVAWGARGGYGVVETGRDVFVGGVFWRGENV